MWERKRSADGQVRGRALEREPRTDLPHVRASFRDVPRGISLALVRFQEEMWSWSDGS